MGLLLLFPNVYNFLLGSKCPIYIANKVNKHSSRCDSCYNNVIPFLLEHMADDQDVVMYKQSIEEKRLSLFGDESKRGLCNHGSTYCQCSKAATSSSKQEIIYICEECNEQKLWDHVIKAAVNVEHDCMMLLVQGRVGWRSRAISACHRQLQRQKAAKSKPTEGSSYNTPAPAQSQAQSQTQAQAQASGIIQEESLAVDLDHSFTLLNTPEKQQFPSPDNLFASQFTQEEIDEFLTNGKLFS